MIHLSSQMTLLSQDAGEIFTAAKLNVSLKVYPLVNYHTSLLIGTSTINGQISVAMLDYRRVLCSFFWSKHVFFPFFSWPFWNGACDFLQILNVNGLVGNWTATPCISWEKTTVSSEETISIEPSRWLFTPGTPGKPRFPGTFRGVQRGWNTPVEISLLSMHTWHLGPWSSWM